MRGQGSTAVAADRFVPSEPCLSDRQAIGEGLVVPGLVL
jgi:hypothetical protein